MKRKEEDLEIGDLVFHLLYGRKWVGVILGCGITDNVTKSEFALVHIQPGSEYEDFFTRSITKHRITSNLGYVSQHWLRKLRKLDHRDRQKPDKG